MSRIKSPPKFITKLRDTLGLVKYFRISVPNFSEVTNPLYSLLKLHPEKSEKQPLWNSEYSMLLSYLTTPPMLAYPDFNQPFKVYTDASGQGLRCAFGFGSRTLVGAEKKYHSCRLKFLGLNWTICDHFCDYLYYVELFDVYKDLNPLTYIKISCKFNVTVQRWVNELANFKFSIQVFRTM